MIVKTAKWGNSIGVRIPRNLAKRTGIGVGSTVDIDEADGRIVIKPVTKQQCSLKELLKGITRQNRHEEVDFGRPISRVPIAGDAECILNSSRL